MPVRRWAAPSVVVLLLALTACGHENDSDRADQPTGSASASPSETTAPLDEWRVLAVVSGSNVGGRTSAPETLAEPAEQNAFLSQFGPASSDDPATRFVQRLQTAIDRADLAPDEVIVGAVVDVSCEAVEEVTVEGEGDALEITPVRSAKPSVECLVPVTSVALVAGPSDLAP